MLTTSTNIRFIAFLSVFIFTSALATGAQSTSESSVISNSTNHSEEEWRTPDSDNLIYMQLDTGLVIMELAPFMSPINVAQFKNLVMDRFYDGLDFYRVIDGFVAQGGDVSESKQHKYSKQLPAELTRLISENTSSEEFMLVQSPDFMAPQTGFLHGFAAGRDPQAKKEWLVHCPGVVAMGRNNALNTASTEFYITIGQATRHLDRNMSVLGKVIYGMDHVQSIKRASVNVPSGVIEDPTKRTGIVWIKLANDVPSQDHIHVQVQNEYSDAVASRLNGGRTLGNEFFHFKGNGNLDVCYYNLKTRVIR
ncbi:peptidylprolyl isomerase [uncultured Paraglaciecola sp.]|uniref:peptidylprolyl isomerase n=1 Tax=uncultured Paraglaciecola sp. TaxID=1765024 RepID=UPI0030D8FDFE|tara:strand:+ start:9537 stop:10460 length:924 start_codon:yes stop_codon:yes gene_type:complete